MGYPTFVYRRNPETGEIDALKCDSDEAPAGWVDTPARVDDPNALADHVPPAVAGVVPSSSVSAVHDAAKPVADMSKEELEQYARDRYGVDLDRRRSHGRLVEQVRSMEARGGHR